MIEQLGWTMIPGTRHVCLTRDTGATPHCLSRKRLDWDDVFNDLPEIDRVIKREGRGAIAVDVGAFIGDTTRRLLDAGYRVFAFEPQPDAFACLAWNCPEAALFNCAVGKRGERVFLDDGPGIDGNLGSRRLVRSGDRSTAAIALDALIEAIPDAVSLVKIDVEGYEPNVLSGMGTLVDLYSPVIIIEVNVDALESHGMTAEDVVGHKVLRGYERREFFRHSPTQYDLVLTK